MAYLKMNFVSENLQGEILINMWVLGIRSWTWCKCSWVFMGCNTEKVEISAYLLEMAGTVPEK